MKKVSKLFRDLCRFEIIGDETDPNAATLIRKKSGDYIKFHLEKMGDHVFHVKAFFPKKNAMGEEIPQNVLKFIFSNKKLKDSEDFYIEEFPVYQLRKDFIKGFISRYAVQNIQKMQKEREEKVKGGKKEYTEISIQNQNNEYVLKDIGNYINGPERWRTISEKTNSEIREKTWKKFKPSFKHNGYLNNLSYHLLDELKKVSPEWAEAFTPFNVFLQNYFRRSGIDSQYMEEVDKINKIIKDNFLERDYNNIRPFRYFFEGIESRNAHNHLNRGGFENFSWETVLNATTKSKKKLISNWPQLRKGIKNLPNYDFRSYTTDTTVLRARLAFIHVIGDHGNSLPIKNILERVKREDINKASCYYQKNVEDRLKANPVSYDMLCNMILYVKDTSIWFIRNSRNPNIDGIDITPIRETFENLRSFKKLMALSLAVHRRFMDRGLGAGTLDRDYKKKLPIDWKEYKIPYPVICPNLERKDGLKITFIDSLAGISKEGEDMHHCVGGLGYIRKAYEAQSYFFHVDYKGEKATAEVNILQGEVIQIHGDHNHHNLAIEEGKEALNKWARRYRKRLNDILKAKSKESLKKVSVKKEVEKILECVA